MESRWIWKLIDKYGRVLMPSRANAGRFILLLGLTRALAEIITPVQPRAEFRDDLSRDLAASARHHYAQRTVALSGHVNRQLARSDGSREGAVSRKLSPVRGVSGKYLILGAAAVGSAISVAGVLAYALHHRNQSVVTG